MVVVTGASKGIGLAISRMLADEGALVVAGALSSRAPDAGRGVGGLIESAAEGVTVESAMRSVQRTMRAQRSFPARSR